MKSSASPILVDQRPQSVQAEKPTVIVGSSQVNANSGDRVIHLDQRSQIDQVPTSLAEPERRPDQIRSDIKPILSSSNIDQDRRPAVIESPKQESVLIGRNQLSSSNFSDSLNLTENLSASQPRPQSDVCPENTELSARNEIRQPSLVQKDVSLVVPVVQQQLPVRTLTQSERPLTRPVVVEQVPVVQSQPVIEVASQVPVVQSQPVIEVASQVPVVQSHPVIEVVPQVPVVQSQPVIEVTPQVSIIPEVAVPVQPVVVVPEQVPQTVVVPEIKSVPSEVPSLEVRSTPVLQSPIQSTPTLVPLQSSEERRPTLDKNVEVQSRNSEEKILVKEDKVTDKQQQAETARNLKVEQTPIKAPVVISSVQKQIQIAAVKPEIEQPQIVPISETKLYGKNAEILPVRSEPVVQPHLIPKPVNANSDQPISILPVQKQSILVPSVSEGQSLQVQPVQIEPQLVPLKPLTEERPQLVREVVSGKSTLHRDAQPQTTVRQEKPIQAAIQSIESVKPVQPVREAIVTLAVVPEKTLPLPVQQSVLEIQQAVRTDQAASVVVPLVSGSQPPKQQQLLQQAADQQVQSLPEHKVK